MANPTLAQADVQDILARFKASPTTATVADLAAAHDVSPAAIKYHLKRHGLMGDGPLAPEPAIEDDAALGIGEDDGRGVSSEGDSGLNVLLADPKMAALIDAAVSSRLAAMGLASTAVPAAPAIPGVSSPELQAFLSTLTHVMDVQAMQQPGYIKPLPAAEVDRRAASFIEMKALLKRFEMEGAAPHYVLGLPFYADEVLWEPGREIRTYLPPAEHFRPQNDAARRVHAAMLEWIGGPSKEIGVLVAEAEAEKRTPLVGAGPEAAFSAPASKRSVEALNVPKRDVSPRRILGTHVPETQPASVGPRTLNQEPVGPAFAAAMA